MCGICGIVRPAGSPSIRQRDVEVMRDVMRHRGPDGEGSFLEEGVGLGHRRLSIVDVAHGAQPMTSDDGRYVIVYNGEVFNHPTLQRDLERDGTVYRTRCDTETVLRLFELRGQAAISLLRGMFAIAIWDRRDRQLFLARDRFGVKPLYYAHLADGSLAFSSEIKGLLASGLVTARLNRKAVPDFLANRATMGEETMFEGVRRLPPAHLLVWRDGALQLRRYWDLPSHQAAPSPDHDHELVEEYRSRLTEAVRLRLMADAPLGAFLSGGIDSAAITALMSGMVDEPVRTFSVAFQEREANELAFARLIATRFRTRHHEVLVSPDAFFRQVPRLLWHEDEPIAHPSSVALNFVSELAAEHVKVVLTGEGSDETLGGYNKYRVTRANVELGALWARGTPASLREAVQRLVSGRKGPVGRRLGRTFLALGPDLDALYLDNFAVFGQARQRWLLSGGMLEVLGDVDPYATVREALARRAGSGLLTQLLYADSSTYLHELLMKQDQMSMAASIESRVPFLDHPLVEFATRLPDRLKIHGATTKVVLRKAMRGILPHSILHRKKMGFPVPVASWFRGPYQDWVEEFVGSDRALARGFFRPESVRALLAEHSGGVNHGERLWLLANLEIWQRIFLDGESHEDIAGTPATFATTRAA